MEAKDSLGFGFKTTMATAQTTEAASRARKSVEKCHHTAKGNNTDNTEMEPHFTIFAGILNLGFILWTSSGCKAGADRAAPN